MNTAEDTNNPLHHVCEIVLTDRQRARFHRKYFKCTESGCWIWKCGTNKDGYGFFYIGKKQYLAHRVSYCAHKGVINNWLFVCHNCPSGDNPSCVNPDHLWLGTHQDNMDDMARKGRRPTGDLHHARRRPECMARGDRNGSRLHPERLKRGDNHPSHLHPERLARGDKHGSKTHPECVLRADKSPCAKLTWDQVKEIRKIYSEGGVSQRALASVYHVTQPLIGYIVRQEIWKGDCD